MKESRLLERWIRFNGVGALGIGVQLATLSWLVRSLDVYYLWATVIAVEIAVLHNFVWHEWWTWRDRPASSLTAVGGRLARFHLANGLISIVGNLALMRLFAGTLEADPVAANIVAILLCSFVNFGASELFVFKQAAVATVIVLASSSALLASEPPRAAGGSDMLAVDLQSRTLEAWNAYEQIVERRLDSATPTGTPFFALDAFRVADWRATAMRGVFMSRLDRARPGDPEPSVPDGKIHHWVGAIFVPSASVPQVLDRLSQLAGKESTHHQDVIASKLLSKDGDRYRIFLKIQRSKVVTVTYNTEHTVDYRRLGATRASARSVSTRIAELEQAGTPNEREKKVGSDSGYLWRLNAYWRYEAVNGGVLIECESVSLSRAVPRLLRPFVTGVVEGLARESLERTLVGLRTSLTN
jgi:putative flippase GtrA